MIEVMMDTLLHNVQQSSNVLHWQRASPSRDLSLALATLPSLLLYKTKPKPHSTPSSLSKPLLVVRVRLVLVLAMGFTKLSPYLLILILSLAARTLGGNIKPACCPGYAPPSPFIPKPPINLPPIITNPPISFPPVIGKPPVTVTPVIPKPPLIISPTLPPVINPVLPYPTKPACPPPPVVKPPCPPTPAPPTACPVDTLKLGVCLEMLGAIVHIGDPAVECCPLIAGLSSVQAAVCLCTTIKAEALGLKVFQHIALELLVICGKTPPPGYSCA